MPDSSRSLMLSNLHVNTVCSTTIHRKQVLQHTVKSFITKVPCIVPVCSSVSVSVVLLQARGRGPWWSSCCGTQPGHPGAEASGTYRGACNISQWYTIPVDIYINKLFGIFSLPGCVSSHHLRQVPGCRGQVQVHTSQHHVASGGYEE